MPAAQALSAYETERGKPMPSRNHSFAQTNLIVALARHGKEYSILSELTLDLPKQELTPDISIYPKLPVDWRHDEIRMSEMPSTVIEILSPTQGMAELGKKADDYFEAGVKSCWIVAPMLQVISILQPDGATLTFSRGEVHDDATGIKVTVEEIFG
jgi:Uma2 family endonuclease